MNKLKSGNFTVGNKNLRTCCLYYNAVHMSTSRFNLVFSSVIKSIVSLWSFCVFKLAPNVCGYMKFLRNAVEQKFGWSEAEPYSRCCMMCLGGGFHGFCFFIHVRIFFLLKTCPSFQREQRTCAS